MKKYGFVYIWFDKKHRRFYIGSHWGTEDDGYTCSSVWMRNSKNNRPHDFKRRVIKKFEDRHEMLIEEQRYLDMIKAEEVGQKYYNLNLKAKGWNWWDNANGKKIVTEKIVATRRQNGTYPHTEETKQKISQITKAQWETDIHSTNCLKGEHRTEKQKEASKINSKRMKGSKQSPEMIAKRFKNAKGRKQTPEWIEKRAAKHRGQTKHTQPKRSNAGVKKGNIPWNKGIDMAAWQCPICSYKGKGVTNAKRWHFDNCKRR